MRAIIAGRFPPHLCYGHALRGLSFKILVFNVLRSGIFALNPVFLFSIFEAKWARVHVIDFANELVIVLRYQQTVCANVCKSVHIFSIWMCTPNSNFKHTYIWLHKPFAAKAKWLETRLQNVNSGQMFSKSFVTHEQVSHIVQFLSLHWMGMLHSLWRFSSLEDLH